MQSAWKSVTRCWGQDDAPTPVCEAVSEKVMKISHSVSEESRIAFRSQADIVSEKSRARTPTRNNRQFSRDSGLPSCDGYKSALNHIRPSKLDPGVEASPDNQRDQVPTMASAESRVPVTLSKPNRDTKATGPPGDFASEKIVEDKRPSSASLQTKTAINRRKIQMLKSSRSRQKEYRGLSTSR